MFSTPQSMIGMTLVLVGATFLFSGCGSCKRFMYEGFWRDRWQQPEAVVAALRIEPGDRVADLGAGGGYFTFHFSDAVGDDGKVLALDVDEDLYAYVRDRARKEGRGNVEARLVAPDDPRLGEASVDMIFLSNVYHHLEQRAEYFSALRPTLAEGGRVVIVEVAPKGWLSRLHGHHTDPRVIADEMRAAGYQLAERHEFLAYQSFQEFTVAE